MSKVTVRLIITAMIAILFSGGCASILAYEEVVALSESKVTRIERVNEMEWQFIVAVLKENQYKAKEEADTIKNTVKQDIFSQYGLELVGLKKDFDSRESSSPIYSILGKSVTGKFHAGIENDNNDPFIASTDGVISDKSLNCSLGKKEMRTWEAETKLHWNKELGSKAIEAIVMQKNPPVIFWEFLPPGTNTHHKISDMELDALKGVYFREGVKGLAGYEFLTPAYIDSSNDILGVADVDNLGRKNKNMKIIVVQGFNLYDVLSLRHKEQLNSFEEMKKKIDDDTKVRKERLVFGTSLLCVVLLTAFWGVMIAQQRERKEDCC